MAFLTAEMFRAGQDGRTEDLFSLVCRQALFLDQAAADQWSFRVAWLLTGLGNPPFHITRAHTESPHDAPFTPLANPSWVGANLAYLRDLDTYIASVQEGNAPPSHAKAKGKPHAKASTPKCRAAKKGADA